MLRQRTIDRDSYTPVPAEDIENHLKSADYVIVRRWLTIEQLRELDAIAAPVWPELSAHLKQDLQSIATGAVSPAEPPTLPPGMKVNPNSPAWKFHDSSSELMHRPRELGGFGAAMCGIHDAGFVLPVMTDERKQIVEKVRLGQSTTAEESHQYQFCRIREFVLHP